MFSVFMDGIGKAIYDEELVNYYKPHQVEKARTQMKGAGFADYKDPPPPVEC